MTSSNFKKLTDLLYATDFAELAAQQKKADLLAKQQAEEARMKEAEERMQRMAEENATPKITEKEVEEAEALGYQNGLEEGKREGYAKAEGDFKKHLEELFKAEEKLPLILKEEVAHIQKQSLDLLQNIISHMLQDAAKNYPEEMLKFVLEKAFETIPENAKVEVNLAPATRFYFEKVAEKLSKGQTFVFKEDKKVPEGDCVLSWNNQGIDARFKTISSQIQSIIESAKAGISPEKIELQGLEALQKTAETPEAEAQAQTEPQEEIQTEETVSEAISAQNEAEEAEELTAIVSAKESEENASSEDTSNQDDTNPNENKQPTEG